MFSCYTTVYTYYMFIVFTEATYLMTDEPPYYTYMRMCQTTNMQGLSIPQNL